MADLIIRNGRIIDPSQSLDEVADLLISDGKIAGIGNSFKQNDPVIEEIDGTGKIVAPGLVDAHVQLREPGFEEDETIASGTAAAINGGFTSIACLPNTSPTTDTQAQVQFIQQKASQADNCHVFVIACVSKNREGQELAELGILTQAGAVAFSDAPSPLQKTDLFRRALEYSRMFDVPVLDHPEMPELSQSGIMHSGAISMVLGLSSMHPDSEELATGRDLRLAETTGARLHLMDISTEGSVELIRRAKGRGVNVTSEVCIANLHLTDEVMRTFDSNYKVNPPLRSQAHIDACIAGLQDGTIDVITSGHAPRASEKKMTELDRAPFGMSQIELTLGLAITHLVSPGHIDFPTLIGKLSTNPARALRLDKGTLKTGAAADITIIDPDVVWEVDSSNFESRSTNTPFNGLSLTGRADAVIVDGIIKLRR
ncbi:MAG: dihydroorotase [Planctomycetaceae bacterium]